MKISKIINGESFGAKLVRSKKYVSKPITKNDVIDSYDRQIEAIKAQKKSAIELDEFMHSKKITKLIEKLPEKAEVKVVHSFNFNMDIEDNIKPRSHKIGYFSNRENSNGEKSSLEDTFIKAQKSDGSIAKDRIVRYLKAMVKLSQ